MHLAARTWTPRSKGDAPTALLLHGITGSSGTWWRVGRALADVGWRVVAMDLPGHGGSPPMDGPMKAQQWAASIREALDGAFVDVAIGHSAGAGAVVELVALDPNVVGRVVLEEPPGAGNVSRPEWAAQLEREVAAARRDPDRIERLLLRQNPRWERQDASEAVEALVACDIEAIAASERIGMGYRVAEVLATMAAPTLLMLAEDERSAFRGDVRRDALAALPPTVAVEHFGTGHVIHRDAFVDYMRALVAWLNGAGGLSPRT